MNISAETLNTIAAVLATFIGTLLFTFRSSREQRKAISIAANKIDESAARQEAAFKLYEKTLTSALNVEKGINNEQRSEIAELKRDVASYKDALDSALKEIELTRADQRQMRVEHDAQLQEMRGQIAGLVKETVDLKKELTDKESQLNGLAKAVQSRETTIGDYVQKLNRFELALQEKDTALIEAQALIANLRQNETRTVSDLEGLRERVRNLETQVTRLNAERDTLLAQLDAAKRDRDRALAERDAAVCRIEALEQQLRALTTKGEGTPLAERTAAAIADMRAELGKPAEGAA